MYRTRLVIVGLMVIGIVLLPSSLHTPSTDGFVSAQSSGSASTTTINPAVYTVATVYTKPELPLTSKTSNVELRVPFNVGSRWASLRGRSPAGGEPSAAAGPEGTLARRGSGDENNPGIWWDTNQGEKYFAIQNGQFISTDSTDTWFVYGWFGPLSAIKENYNIKYPKWGDRHNGIDFAGREGIDVVSASAGQVIFAGHKIGNTVIVKMGDYQITYGHLQNISVKIGQQIKVGDLIGHLGNSGTTNPHLHFQVDYINDRTRIAINPAPLIDIDWDRAIIPAAPSNQFYAGSAKPALQSNFFW